MTRPLHIGLIGGIGPAATALYYRRLTDAMRAADQRLDLTIVHADVLELVNNNQADNRAAQARIYARLIDRLAAAGAECAAITSIGGHFCYREAEALSALPLVSAITPLDYFLAERGLTKVGLLGTEEVMRGRLYGQLFRTGSVVPETNLAAVARTYEEVAMNGHCSEAQRAAFFEAGQRMVEDQGAEAIVLAGTDLGLAFDGHDPGYRWIDALGVHVAVLADLATGRRGLNDLPH